jgi:hypothetical protein
MGPLVASTDDLISVLDRVLDKGIVIDPWVRLTLQGPEVLPAGSKIGVASSAVYVGYGNRGSWREDLELEDLFPYWRRELWSK